MAFLRSPETLSRLIPLAQILIVLLTVFTIWASVQKGRLEKLERDKLSHEIESTKIELEKSNEELSIIRKSTSPRQLTHEQIQLLEKSISVPSEFLLLPVCRITDTEGHKFAEQIANVFKEAKWKVAEINRTFLDDISSDMTIVVTEPSLLFT